MKTDKLTMLLVPLVGVALGAAAGGCGTESDGTPPRGDRAATTTKAPPPHDPAPRPGVPAPPDGRVEVGQEPPAPPPAPARSGSEVQVGDQAPDFELTTTDGTKFKLSDQRGKVVVILFFATWCRTCQAEMPRLQQDVYGKFKGDRFALIAIGREHENAEVARFKAKRGLGFPMAGDPSRAVFGLYADKSIPRTLVVDRDGKILFESVGYFEKDFKEMLALLREKVDGRPR